MNALDRIRDGLTKNTGKWVHSHVIYTKLQNEGYTTESIKRALDTVHRTAPFAMVSVKGDDYRTLEQMGVHSGGYYFIAHQMSVEELERSLRALDAFDELP